MLGSGEHCRPCPCPGSPSSGHFNAHSCQADLASNQITCNCRPGYKGRSQSFHMSLDFPTAQSQLGLCVCPQGPAVTSVPQVTTATLNKPVASACRASATATLTPWTRSHVTPEVASVSSACTTPKALPAPTASWATMATLWPRTADVSSSSSSRHTSGPPPIPTGVFSRVCAQAAPV